MNIRFLRHAQSIYNESKLDFPDCPLSDTGIKQAKELSGNYDLVIVSNLQRSQNTLTYSAITYKQKIVCELIREVVVDLSDTLVTEFFVSESIDSVQFRIQNFMQYLKSIQSQSVLIISHKDFLQNLTGKTLQNAESLYCIFDKDTEKLNIL